MKISTFGQDAQGHEAKLYTIKNSQGTSATLCNFGARLMSLLHANRDGELVDVVLGFDTLEEYQTRSGYLGATCGRFSNRIAGASFQLNGVTYQLFANNGKNSLHGGKIGFDKKFWDVETPDDQTVTFTYLSVDGEEGYPGNLKVSVTYHLNDQDELSLLYKAQTDADTVINLTNHSYFNLAGEGTILDHLLTIKGHYVLEASEDLIPTGDMTPVADSPYDLLQPTRLGDCLSKTGQNKMFDRANGFDINYVLDAGCMREVAELSCPSSGRRMRVYTDQPGIQVYSGQGLKSPGRHGKPQEAYSGIALETQHFPDSVHHPHFPTTVLKAGETFSSQTIYRLETM